ncbi:MAG TPA: tetratricopeptide repeat protein [Bacteroidales bacterium]|nr:tetratricopeptide repeat protein [Bacteroidales bacterium]
MYKKIITIGLFFVLCFAASGQTADNIPAIDQRTFLLWQQKNWKQLLKEGNAALDKGFDFYFLRVRMGVACYEQKNYHLAIKHFEKARKFNDEENDLKEYLYYAYVFSGRQAEARKLAAGFDASLKGKTGTNRHPFLSELRLLYNADFNHQKTTPSNFIIDVDSVTYGKQYLSNNHHYIHMGFTHDISPGFSIDHGYSFVNQHYFLYKHLDSLTAAEPDYVSNVHQYYINGNIRLAKSWYLGLGLHYIGVRYTVEGNLFGRGGRRQATTKKTDSDISLFLNVKKDFSYISVGGAFYYSTLNNARQIQADVGVRTYPLGNLNLYTNTVFSWQHEKISGNAGQRVVLQQEVGGRIFKYLWLEVFGVFGDVHNFLAQDGRVVYNNADVIKIKCGVRLIIPVNNKLHFMADYAFSGNESYFEPTKSDGTFYNKKQYNNHSLTGGIIWNFSKPAKY